MTFRPFLAILSMGLILSLANLLDGAKLRECGDPNWFPDPKGDKCFKILRKMLTKQEGHQACLEETQYLYDDPLLTVLSKEEHDFIVLGIFEERHVQNDLWLGGFRKGVNDWRWDDNSSVQYSFWKDKSHTLEKSESCFRMLDDIDPNNETNFESYGLWEAVSCSSKNLVVCQKSKASVQQKSIYFLQQQINQTKRELDQAKQDLQTLRLENQQTRKQLNLTQENLNQCFLESNQTKYQLDQVIEQATIEKTKLQQLQDHALPELNNTVLKLNQTSEKFGRDSFKIKSRLLNTESQILSLNFSISNQMDVLEQLSLNISQTNADTEIIRKNLIDLDNRLAQSTFTLTKNINLVQDNVTNLRDTAVSLNTKVENLSTKFNNQIENVLKNSSETFKNYLLKMEDVRKEFRDVQKTVNDIKNENRAFSKNLDVVKWDTENLARSLNNKADNSSVERALRNMTDVQGKISKDLNEVQSLSSRLNSSTSDLQRSLRELQRVTVPIGFVYIQYPWQQHPESIWPGTTWSDISDSYAGSFFRVLGGNSNGFGDRQSDSTRQIIRAQYQTRGSSNSEVLFPQTGWTDLLTAGRHVSSNNYVAEYLRFETSNTEVRPQNYAIRVFRRTT